MEIYNEIDTLLRSRLLPEIKYVGKSKGRRNTFGIVYRMAKKWKPPHPTPLNKKYKDIYEALVRLGDAIVPFKYDSITVNQNNVCKIHADKGNLGASLIVSGGDYKGGELNIEHTAYQTGPVIEWKTIDTKYKPLVFDGACRHWNNDILSGFKWSVVFYKIEMIPKWIPLFPEDINDPNREYSLIDLITDG